MRLYSKTGLNPFIPKALAKAAKMLNDRKALVGLIGSASAKIESGSARITALKSDIETLVELIKAWINGVYREIPWTTLLLGTGAVVYFVNPLDAIPDILPATGLLDDASVIGFVLASAKNDIERFRKHKTGAVLPAASD
jgi:uncharacterized membrane protein YkvA (DUF1232 family)